MEYFRVKNWEKYQHRDALRGTGHMKWIRIETTIFEDEKVWQMKPSEKLIWIGILIVAGKYRNKIPSQLTLLKQVLCMQRTPNIDFLYDLGLLEPFECRNIAADLPPREEKRREEKNNKNNTHQHDLSYMSREGVGDG